MAKSKLALKDHISIIALCVAFVSLVTSIRSCQRAERSLNLAEQDFQNSRSVFWTGVVETNIFQLSVYPSEVKIQAVKVTFPKSFNLQERDETGVIGELAPLQTSISFKRFNKQLIEIMKKEITYTNGTMFMTPPVPNEIPIVFETRYILKGQVSVDRSLYSIPINFYGTVGPREAPFFDLKIEYGALQFVSRLKDEGASLVVETIWGRFFKRKDQSR